MSSSFHLSRDEEDQTTRMRKAVSQCGARDCSIDFDFEQQHRWAGTVTIVHPYERHDVAGDDVVDGDEDDEVDSVGPPRRKWMVR